MYKSTNAFEFVARFLRQNTLIKIILNYWIQSFGYQNMMLSYENFVLSING